MNKLMGAAVAALLILAGGYVVLARSGALMSSDAEARAAYGGKTATVDGVTLRYKDEGQGPVLVLLHAGNHSLEMWDGWVATLKNKYRIIRPDMPPYGLSQAEAIDKNSNDRSSDLVLGLLDQLGVTDFALAGISSGSTVALRVADKRPAQVKVLLLCSVPLVPPAGGGQPLGLAASVWVSENLLGGHRPRWYWREQLKMTYGDDSRIPDAVIARQQIINNRPGQTALADAYAANNRRSGYQYAPAIAKMTTPVLVQWGGASPVLPPSKAPELAKMFAASTDVQTIIYPTSGHYLYLEQPEETARDAATFLAKHGFGN